MRPYEMRSDEEPPGSERPELPGKTSATLPEQLQVRPIAPAYEQVAGQLRGLILRGELASGERLPSEERLAGMFGVSRATVRESLRIISSQNLITTRKGVGGGSFVAQAHPDHISDFLEASIGLLSGSAALTVENLLEARELLEVPAARMAAARRSDADLAAMRDVLAQEAARLSRAQHFEEHRRFHQAVLAASGNSLLEIVTRPVFMVLRMRFVRDAAPPSFWEDVAAEHRSIFEPIAARDGDGAARAMRVHLARLAGTYVAIDRTRERPAEHRGA